MEYGKFLVISLEMGSAKAEEKYSPRDSAKWRALRWLFCNGDTPIIDIFSEGSADMADILASTPFQTM
ncbi:hypothetical protein HPP92_027162 [Vanilla planifolia]|uniref:Uncharacterized protein n=1 Tax=Vanilla planifolia TaxID=51239 RepID=A0A835PC88_VANPL|nr:hypothetical protein HPP92_027162 [Vanilla planifolia]